mgnify:CR=1 FL=1
MLQSQVIGNLGADAAVGKRQCGQTVCVFQYGT